MFPRLITVSCSLLLALLTIGQDIKYARSIIEKLSAPEMHGRGYVQNGDKLAAEFIKSEFEALGIEPVNSNYFQHFSFPVNTIPGKLELEINGLSLVPGKDFQVDPGSPAIYGAFETVLIRRELLMNPTRLMDTLSYTKDKFILLDIARDTGFNDIEKSSIEFLKYDINVPARGVIELTDEKLTWHVSTKVIARPVITINKKITPEMAGMVYIVIEQEFVKNYRGQNVIATIKGKSNPDSLILISAHYDHLGRMGDKTYFPGANDNASGVGLLLDLAKHFNKRKNQPKYTILFVAFGAEELGLLGSRYFIEQTIIDIKNIKFLINLDISGTGDDGITVVNGNIYTDEFQILKNINQEKKLLPTVNSRGEACISDHCFFHQLGVKSFYIYTLGGIQAYHDIYDRYETLPLTAYEGYFELLDNFIKEIQK